ncbi:aldehyde dehydrogenase family protein [Dietzia sp.]|uniref:aldehyde dehydrogenase family protein n=1 Tax=Dietzia sp. TaxID=1871616 RepID=UPI002FDA0A8B
MTTTLPTPTPIFDTPADVERAVAGARKASARWQQMGFEKRRGLLDAWRADLAKNADRIAETLSEEMGKPHSDAMFEIVMALEHLAWAAKNAEKVLGRRRVATSALTSNLRATVEYLPYGVVGVIGPWNYPVFTPMGSVAFALAAGNSVVFKPSEWTPRTGQALIASFHRATGEFDIAQCITGGGDVGAALCRSGVDKIGFTGSTATGKRILAACAENLTPALLECGGKDALVVDADADVAAAADAAVWGAMSNAGQTCLAVERVYIHEAVAEEFTEHVLEAARALRAADDGSTQIGRMTMPRQVEIVRSHISDALSRGGQALLGGLGSIDGQVVQPVVLTDVPEDSAAVTEETFGPTMTIRAVADMDEAVRLTNASEYALGLTVCSKRNGRAIADRITSGNVSINGYVMHAAVPTLPLGGVKQSGFGRVHGADGLREFAYARACTETLVNAPIPLTSFKRGPKVDELIGRVVKEVHGRAGAIRQLLGKA